MSNPGSPHPDAPSPCDGSHPAPGRLARIRTALARPGAWIDRQGAGYALRMGGDRRSRVQFTLDEAGFRTLVRDPGLIVRPGGGWTARSPRPGNAPAPALAPGRPGFEAGERIVLAADGRATRHVVNLGESPILWLHRRKDADGRPFLTAAQAAAGERLRLEAEIALKGPSLTMRWDALPRAGGGSSARVEPSDRALAAARRVETALAACGPRLRPMVEQICIHGTALQLAERDLGVKKREGKLILTQGLSALAAHYGIG